MQELCAELNYAIDRATDELYPQYKSYTLSPSLIGHECKRYIFYNFRWMAPEEIITPRMKRLFSRGDDEEARFHRLIEKIGFKRIIADNKRGQHKIEALNGHFKGYADDLLNTENIDESKYPKLHTLPAVVLGEYKTSCTGRGFTDYRKTVILHRPLYYAQICVYGYMLDTPTCIFLVANKNDDDIYAEVIELDFAHAKRMLNKAEEILNTKVPPNKIAQSPSFSVCKNCKFSGICHEEAAPNKNCRSCVNSRPVENKQWLCEKYSSVIPNQHMEQGCDLWEAIY